MCGTPAVAQPPQVPGRIGQAVRMVDPQSVDEPLGDQCKQLLVRGGEHLWVLLPQRGEPVDVEEATVEPGRRIDVEELLPQLRVAPEAVLLVGGHVVRDAVEHDAEPGAVARSRNASLAAEVLREPRWIGDVVAVRRPRAGLQRGER